MSKIAIGDETNGCLSIQLVKICTKFTNSIYSYALVNRNLGRGTYGFMDISSYFIVQNSYQFIEKLNITLSGTDRLNIQEFVLTLSTLAPSIEFSDYNGNLPAIITSQQLSSFTLIEIQMNAQILNAIKQCF
ncbi:11391_t:CDS:2 [Funneliformis mosseae]|uniref:11391_t:CDS:1 n=1 Tax=Funneliformis mosseae TaxID=27381 RepID=A0A9N9ALC0_FUNMO|nr:11391_t:CDS:2 [Funneliformis mosseae]